MTFAGTFPSNDGTHYQGQQDAQKNGPDGQVGRPGSQERGDRIVPEEIHVHERFPPL